MGSAQVAVPGLKVTAEDDKVILDHKFHKNVTVRFTREGVTVQYGSDEPKVLRPLPG